MKVFIYEVQSKLISVTAPDQDFAYKMIEAFELSISGPSSKTFKANIQFIQEIPTQYTVIKEIRENL